MLDAAEDFQTYKNRNIPDPVDAGKQHLSISLITMVQVYVKGSLPHNENGSSYLNYRSVYADFYGVRETFRALLKSLALG